MLYFLFLPTALSDPRPSTTVVTAIVLAAVLSTQLLFLQSSFSQQAKDSALIHKEVMNEYDTKYVHPRTQPLMRDVGTQFSDVRISSNSLPQYEDENDSVDVYAPTFIINRGFQTRPNPNYVKHVDPKGFTIRSTPLKGSSATMAPPIQTPAHQRDISSPIRPETAIRQPQLRPSGRGDGGSLGVFSHANSPLRKPASTNLVGGQGLRERSLQVRGGSPVKRSSLAPVTNESRWTPLPANSARRESGMF